MGANLLDRRMAQLKADYYCNGMAIQQMMADAAVIALHRAFGFGPSRQAKFMEELHKAAGDMADLILEDTSDVIYSRERIDKLLLQIVGPELFVPWDERYQAAVAPGGGNRRQRRARRKK